jgi:hypothetical protein
VTWHLETSAVTKAVDHARAASGASLLGFNWLNWHVAGRPVAP